MADAVRRMHMRLLWNRGSLILGLLLCAAAAGFSGCGGSGSILKNEPGMSVEETGAGELYDAAESQPDNGAEAADGGDSQSGGGRLAQNAESSEREKANSRAAGAETAGSGAAGAETAGSGAAAAERAGSSAVGADDAADSQDTVSETQERIFVDVCGAVKHPGVYQLSRGSRVYEAIALAGGFLEEAESSLVNQAGVLEDGQQLRIYTKQEAEELAVTAVVGPGGSQPSGQSREPSGQQTEEQKININQADKDALMTLTGIGETRAEAIIAYREASGGFSSIEELMQVDGIKEKTYEKLKDKITVQ